MMQINERAVAEKLLQVQAVKFNVDNPYTWASGWKSPIYCDNRKLLSFPFERDFIKSELCAVIFEKFPDAEAIAGVATAGIAWGALAADQLKLPFCYVRPRPKEHGLENQIEGVVSTGLKLVVVEDLVSTGKSSLQVCATLKQAGADILGMVSIFSYNFPQAHAAFDEAKIPLYALGNYEILVELAAQQKLMSDDQINSLLNWRKNPEKWGI